MPPTTGDVVEVARRREIASRTENVIVHVLTPSMEALDNASAYFGAEASMEAMPSGPPDVEASAYDLAVAKRIRELSRHCAAATDRVRADVAKLRELARAPLEVMTPPEQLRFWLREIREHAYGRERFEFSDIAVVEISGEYVRDTREFLTVLFVDFVRRWEDATADYLRAEGASPDQVDRFARFTTATPSWRQLQDVPEYELSEEDALTLVAAGIILDLWEPFPPRDQLAMYSSELEIADAPFLQAGTVLHGVVMA